MDPVPAVNPQHHPSVQGFERVARDAAQRFRGKNLRVHRSRVVHAVGWYRWLGELYLPGPACRTGWAGAAVVGELHAVDLHQPVTCRKCQHTAEAENVRRFVPQPAAAVQLELVEPDPDALFELP